MAPVSAARASVRRWIDASHDAPLSGVVKGSAFDRVLLKLPPSKQGKNSAEDCVIFETYLDVGSASGERDSGCGRVPVIEQGRISGAGNLGRARQAWNDLRAEHGGDAISAEREGDVSAKRE